MNSSANQPNNLPDVKQTEPFPQVAPKINPNIVVINKQNQNRTIATAILLVTTIALIGISVFIALRSREVSDPEDTADQSNTCCTLPDCENYDGNFADGIEACQRGECSKCAANATICDGDDICETGENVSNCSSDCDAAGYSEIAEEGESCDPDLVSGKNDECDASEDLACITCPDGSTINVERAFCSEFYDLDVNSYTASETFVKTYCGGFLDDAVDTAEDCGVVDVQFEQGTITSWENGPQITARGFTAPTGNFHINCFVPGGGGIVNNSTITLTNPQGGSVSVNTPEARNLLLQTAGTYTGTCTVPGGNTCSESFTVLPGAATPPVNPTNPTNPTNPINPTNTGGSSNLPTTGIEDTLPVFYIIGAGLMFVGLLFVFRNSFKNEA